MYSNHQSHYIHESSEKAYIWLVVNTAISFMTGTNDKLYYKLNATLFKLYSFTHASPDVTSSAI